MHIHADRILLSFNLIYAGFLEEERTLHVHALAYPCSKTNCVFTVTGSRATNVHEFRACMDG